MFDLTPRGSSIPQDLVPRYPHHVVPKIGETSVAVLIMPATFLGLMVHSIEFNDQLQRHATEYSEHNPKQIARKADGIDSG